MKKRLIVVSVWGFVTDYGYMDIEELEKEKRKMIDCNKYTPGDPVRTFARVNNIDDLVIICWRQDRIR